MSDYGPEQFQKLSAECERLKKELEEAKASSEAKENFLSNMSHDIRTPMNAIVGMTALAKNHIDEKSRVMDALDKIEVASAHLLSLINDVLDMSRINSGRMRLVEERFQLGDLLHEILVIVQPMSDARGHEFVFETGTIDRESLYGDPLRLRQIFVNIISNAVKYTKEKGRIRVGISEETSGDTTVLIFECKDNGIGMSEEFLQRIYDPFERVHSSTISGIEGTGLGMSIVKKLVEEMRGTIQIESREGAGTDVFIRIPLKSEVLSVDAESIRGKRLIVIENDAGLIEQYRRYLDETGLELQCVGSSSDAVSALAEADYLGNTVDGVIIGRKLLPGEDLFEVASYLKKAKPTLSIILADNHRFEEIEYRAERAGIDRFLPIPFFRKSLIRTLTECLGGTGREAHGALSIPDLSGKTILLAEDNMINREIAKEILSSTKVSIETAENGQEAVRLFSASEPFFYTLILMDIQMPVMDGYSAVSAIRAMERPDASSIPIYAMTANAFAEDIEKAHKAGMNGHLAKPVDVNALMQLLRRFAE